MKDIIILIFTDNILREVNHVRYSKGEWSGLINML